MMAVESPALLPTPPSTPSSPSTSSEKSEQFNQVFELTFLKFLPSNEEFLVESRLIHNGAVFKVSRKYDDFILLNANLIHLTEPSTIMPPLPESFEAGETILPPDQEKIIKTGGVDSRNVEEFSLYLKAILRHSKMGGLKIVEDFFIESNLQLPFPQMEKKKSGLLSKFSQSSPSKKIVTQIRDIDDFYDKQRFFIISFDAKLQVMKFDFENLLVGNRKLCNVLSHFATSITAALVVKEETNSPIIPFMKTFCSSLESFRTHMDLAANLAYQHLGVILQYLFLYNLTFKEMYALRSDLMVKYETANRNLQKSLESKNFDKIKEEKVKAEKEFEKFSDNGRQEIQMFHDYRQTFLLDSLQSYKRNQLVMARKTVNLLRQSIDSLKQL